MRNAYLFAWNPANWEFRDLEKNLNEIRDFGKTTMDWKVQSTRKIRIGDQAYVMRVGDKRPGIFASGTISRLPYPGPYFKDPTQLVPKVDIDFEFFLDPFKVDYLSLKEIEEKIPSGQFWTPHQSGIQIREEVAGKLEQLWNEFTSSNGHRLPDIPIHSLFEGTPYQQVIKSYERSSFARELCLAHYSYDCAACEMNFETTYGEIGRRFIHVHHVNEMAVLTTGRYTDPIADLRPVCPNCHAMLHKQKPAMAIDDLRKILAERKIGSK